MVDRLLFQQPAVPLRLSQVLSREIGCAHHHRAGNLLVSSEEIRLDSVHLRIDAAKI